MNQSQKPHLRELKTQIKSRLHKLHSRIEKAGGKDITLIAVSKAKPLEAAIAAFELGCIDLGENYAQELSEKAEQWPQEKAQPRWHFIGQLQSNKVRSIHQHVDLWQSVDRAKIASEIAKRAPGARVLAQVNLAGAQQKAGTGFDGLKELVETIHSLDLELKGLMGVGVAEDAASTAAGFEALRKQCDEYALEICSMGMSQDLEIAIECGSTMLRIGSDIFGQREYR